MKWYKTILRTGSAAMIGLALSCHMGQQEKPGTQPAEDSAWKKIGPGGGGFNYLPTFSYTSPDRFLVKCNMNGSYLTRNGGASYSQVNFPNGASSYAYDPNDSNRIFIGSATLNRSADGGQTWEQLFPKKEQVEKELYKGDEAEYRLQTFDTSLYRNALQAISAIRVDPADRGSLYFSIKERFYYTFDDGVTINKQDLDGPVQFIYAHPKALPGEVYIFTSGSMVVFNKRTKTFERSNLPATMAPAFSITGGINRQTGIPVFYALHYDERMPHDGEFGSTQVWVTEDKGLSWKQRSDSLISRPKEPNPSFSMIACAEFDAQQAYLVCNLFAQKNDSGAARYWYGAFKTADAGASWKWVWKGGGGTGQYGLKDGVGVSNLSDAWAESAFGGEFIQMTDAGVYPHDANIAVLTDWYRTMKTTDGGASWVQIYSAREPDGSFYSTGMDNTTSYGVHFDPFDSSHLAISYTDIGFQHSYNNGRSWKRSVEGVPQEWTNTCYWMSFDPEVKGRIWSAWSGMHDIPRGKMTRSPDWKKGARGGVCMSDNGGRTWTKSNAGMGDDSPTTCILLDPRSPANRRTLYAAVYNKGVFKSSDNGITWSLKNKGIGENTSAFELTLAANGDLYLTISAVPAHENGKMGRKIFSGEVYKSTDGAESWKRLIIAPGLLFPNGMETDPEDPQRIYLACWSSIELSDLIGKQFALSTGGNQSLDMPGGIFLSENGGATWKQVFDPGKSVYDVNADPYHNGRLYACTFNQAAYRSDDRGATWKIIRGFDFQWGHRIIPDRSNQEKIFLTTFGSSVWYGRPITE